jgi:solute carrier family 35 protein C2
MLKASSPIFVVASAFLFRLEPITAGLIVVVLIICCGEFLTVYGESQDTFDTVGAIFCLLASVCSGLRWTIVQFLIQSLDPPLKSAIATMRLVSPCMFVFMLACSFAMERPLQTFGGGGAAGGDDGNDNHLFFDNLQHSLTTVGMAAMGGVLAVSMILCELFLIMKSSAIILMVGGVVKELCTICLGVLVFHDVLNAINVLGFLIVFMGVMLYKLQFHLLKMQEKEQDTPVVAENEQGVMALEDGDSSCLFSYDDDDDNDDDDDDALIVDRRKKNTSQGNNGHHEAQAQAARTDTEPTTSPPPHKQQQTTKNGYTSIEVL